MPFDPFPLNALVFQVFLFPAFAFMVLPPIALLIHWGDKDGLDGTFSHRNITILRGRLLQDLLLSLYLGLYLFRRHASLNLLEYLLSHLFPHRHPHLFQSEPFLFRPEPLDLTQANLFFLRNGWVCWFANARVVLSQNHGSGSDCQHCNCDCAFHRFLFFEIFLTFVATAP